MKTFYLVCIIAFLLPAGAVTQNRYALIIGNNAYKNINPLSTPVNDAQAIAASLRNLGWDVDQRSNVGNIDMGRAITTFVNKLKTNPTNEGFFWYAGHGVEIDGQNYLLPVDIADEEDAVLYSSTRLSDLLTRLRDTAKNQVNVVIIDACRNNPFSLTPDGTRGAARSRGLAVEQYLPQDLFLMYSTAPGTTADDGTTNSPFTEAFLQYIARREPMVVMVTRVVAETSRLTKGVQRPYLGSSSFSLPDYSLAGIGSSPPLPPPQPAETTGKVTVTSPVAGTVVYNGYEQSTRISANQSITFNNVQTGSTTWAVKLDDGRTTDTRTVTVQAGQTATVTIPAPAVTLQVPRNVRAGTPGTDSVQLTWDSAGVGISYRVYYNTQNNASSANALGDSTTGTSFNVTGMAHNSTYYFWVSSIQNGRESAKSPAVTVRTASAPVPVQPSIPANFVRIPGGTFMMGSPSSEVNRSSSEIQHRVTITGFSMSKYEVTQKEYQEVMGTNPSYFKGDNLPVEQVTWYGAIEYCNARSGKEGLTPAYTIDKSRKDPNNNAPTNSEYDWQNDNVRWVVTWNRSANGYRLPTEAEWEYACRAGTTTPFSTGTNITTNQANYNGNNPYNGNAKGTYRERTWAVGSGTANTWGLYDMHGNVWEWCWDWYGDYNTASQADPAGVASGSSRVLRGGSWIRYARFLRSAGRGLDTPTSRYGKYGFRVVLP
ncbi:hypothetical protein FACS1894172_19570 [Spirochaetia bacterium]|nr:hypothetical protein FACS1894164_02840 [Spirochaetia bacterium]GHU36576.1 hypothetical protein FACS1894172_19570 [Spirochaetia bacterium]